MRWKNGLTLLEIVFTITLIAFLVSSIAFLYIVSLRGWDNLIHRTDLHEKLHFALERMVRDVRTAKEISVANHSLRFTLREGGIDNSYIYYLYHSDDPWIPAYNQSAYELRRSALAGGIGGTFAYGVGDIIVTGLKPPNDTTITIVGSVASITLVGQDENETLKVRSNVRPRNIPLS